MVGRQCTKGNEKSLTSVVVSPSDSEKVEDRPSLEDFLRHRYKDLPPHIRDLLAPGLDDADSPATTAELLKEQVSRLSKIPSDPLVRQQFGYSKVDSVEEEICLQGLYKGLFMLSCGPSPDEIEEWVQQDKLAEGIERSYGGGQSGYLNWFKRNKHVFSQSYERVGGPWDPDEIWFRVDSKKLDELTRRDTESEEGDDI